MHRTEYIRQDELALLGALAPAALRPREYRHLCHVATDVLTCGCKDVLYPHARTQEGGSRRMDTLYGPTLRLHGSGRFERQLDSVWKMTDFRVERHEVLDDRTIHPEGAAALGNRLMEAHAAREIAADWGGEMPL